MDYFKTNGSHWLQTSYSKQSSLANQRRITFAHLVDTWHPKSIMDIGCGDGRFLSSLNTVEIRLGIDSSEQMLEIASRKVSGVQFVKEDINDPHLGVRLNRFGKFELITMQGVLHYLDSPLDSLSRLEDSCHENTIIAFNFRNRLFNVNPKSKYFNSPKTILDKNSLNAELYFWKKFYDKKFEFSWSNVVKKNVRFGKNFWMSNSILDTFEINLNINGTTDDFWNPDNLTTWKQFSPLEILAILRDSGFEVVDFLPIRNQPKDLEIGCHWKSLTSESSLVALAKKMQ